MVVLGSTTDQTTIYASIDRQFEGRLAERAADYTVQLLRFMGAQAVIDRPAYTGRLSHHQKVQHAMLHLALLFLS